MRNLLALVGLLVVVFLGVGYSRGWYNFSFTKDQNGQVKVDGTIDSGKVKSDSGQGLKKAGETIESFWNRNNSGSAAPPATLPVEKK
jgi:hypothetical protein